jgi:hypothetical protein
MTTQTLATIRRYMTPHQARCATLGMNAREIENLAWVLERLEGEKLQSFIRDMSGGVDDLMPEPSPSDVILSPIDMEVPA